MILEKLKINPKNPRTLTGKDFLTLKAKIKAFPQMLEKRPVVYDKDFIVIGGNQRCAVLKELSKEGFEIKDNYFMDASSWSDEQVRQFTITDNISDGNWNYDKLANEWDDLPLENWGINTTGWIAPNATTPDGLWNGMPAFDGKPAFNVFKSIMVHFKSEEDYQKFMEFINQPMTPQTRYIYFPFEDKEDESGLSFEGSA